MNAVKSKDVKKLRLMMKTSLFLDPTFQEFEEMNRLASSVPGLYVPYDNGPLKTDPAEWTKDYMKMQLVELVDNFSKERVMHVKMVVRHYYAQEAKNEQSKADKDSSSASDEEGCVTPITLSNNGRTFIAFNEDKFWEAIKSKDYLHLKVNAVSSMLQDPTFARGETDRVLKILEANVPEIFEKEVHLSYEERLERNEWTKSYFTKLTYWFQENFAKSRVAYIKEVGRAVHKDTERGYNECIRKYNEDVAKMNKHGERKSK